MRNIIVRDTMSEPLTYTPKIEIRDPGLHLSPKELPWQNGLLIRGTNWLGDIMMTLPAVRELARHVPEPCGVFVLAPKALAPLWEAAAFVSHVIPMEGKRLTGIDLKETCRFRAGVGIVLPNSFGSAMDIWRTPADIRIGRAGRGRRLFLTHALPEWRRGEGLADRHQVSHYLEIAAVFGEPSTDVSKPALDVPDAEETASQVGVKPSDGRWLVLAPGAAYGPAKQWPIENYRDIARRWVQEGCGNVVVVGTASEAPLAEEIRREVPAAITVAGKTSLTELVAVLTVADAVVANDSGAMHLAAGLGTSGVAVFGSTDPFATGPLGAPWIILRDPPDCAPCFQRQCTRESDPYVCLRNITPDQVWKALQNLNTGI